MLPGFRFLFAAILLSTSILVFGLGAASLLRATHEQYVSTPPWRNGPQEQVFAQAPEPVLAALRVEPVADEATPAQVPSIGLPAVTTAPEQMAAVTREDNAPPEPQVAPLAPPAEAPPATEAPAPEPARSEAAPADTLTPADMTTSTPAKMPAPAVSATDVPRTATAALASRVTDIAAARVAALNDLARSGADSAASKPRAQKPRKRHRIVRRPPPPPVQQALDPFGQQQQTFATTTRTR